LYKEAGFEEETKHGMIMEAIQPDRSLSHFVLLRKARTFSEVKEVCLEYAEHQRVYALPRKGTGKASSVPDVDTREAERGTGDRTLDKMDILCKKFEDLALLISKSKPKQNIQEVICHKCKKPGHYANEGQIQTEAVKSCSYCGRYGHSAIACFKKQADEARARSQSKNIPQVQILKKEAVTPAEQNEIPVMYV